ncbi:hypothetical protein [Candidatus Odyssella thessalonicensis]|uniref:hypothetical protein n=1 Tax=Candidatus Odyssella thessalonicensis TaxID=84647 RepID=UPI000225AF7C|nr:hypothetical protein [Candidatus Odyssella thessalonicensis]
MFTKVINYNYSSVFGWYFNTTLNLKLLMRLFLILILCLNPKIYAMDWPPVANSEAVADTDDYPVSPTTAQALLDMVAWESSIGQPLALSPLKHKEPSSQEENTSPLKKPRLSFEESQVTEAEKEVLVQEEEAEPEITLSLMARGIARRNLDYVYQGKLFSTYAWHVKAASDLQRLVSEPATEDEPTNFLRMRVDAIFLKPGGLKPYRRKYKINYTFTSKKVDPRDRSSSKFPILTRSQLVADSTNSERVKKHIKELLANKGRGQEYSERNRFQHTEVTALLYLLEKDDWLSSLLEGQQEQKGNLVYLVINLVSYYDPCPSCSNMVHDCSQRDSYFNKKVTKKWMRHLKKEAESEAEQEQLGIFFGISALKEYKSSRALLQALYADPISLEHFAQGGYFAQMHLDIGLEAAAVAPIYTTRWFIQPTAATLEEEALPFSQISEEQSYDTQAALYFEKIFNGGEESKKFISRLRKNVPDLIPLADNRPELTEEQIRNNRGKFIDKFVEYKERQEQGASSQEQEGAPSKILNRLMGYLISYREFKKEHHILRQYLETDLAKIGESSKGQRDSILGIYTNKMLHKTNIMDAAYLLKLYGYLYLGDNVKEDDIPNNMKDLKKKPKKVEKKEKDFLTELQRMQNSYKQGTPNEILGKTARLLEKVMRTGRFHLERKKYYWKKK